MRITQLSLTDFILVKDSGISVITIDFTENVQIIIGTNGSGKSSIMRQLSLIPAPRSLFGKNGHKSITVEHNGTSYKLSSEYEKPSAPHAFQEWDSEENLNIGRTTDTQKDLILEHLGVTPFIDDLIMNRFVFPKWGGAKRKEFLMAHNPDDIGFVFTLAKQETSKIKACKNNLARLQSRKILLEQDIVSDEVMEELRQEKAKISDDLGYFQQNMMDIEVGLRTLNGSSTTNLYDISGIKKTLRRIRYKMAELSHVERDDHARGKTRDKLVGDLASCDHQIKSIDEQMINDATELNELEAQYRELAPDADLREIENTINRLEADRDRLKVSTPPFELSRQELEARYVEWEALREKLLIFETCSIPLLPQRKRSHRNNKLEQAKYKQSAYDMRLGDLRTQYEDLSKRHTLSPSDIPDEPCSKNKCPLYAHFMEGYQDAEGKRNHIKRRIDLGKRKLERLSRYISACSRYFEDSRVYHDVVRQIIEEAGSNPVLHSVLRGMDILTTLSTSPNRISRKLKEEYDHLDQWLKLKLVLSDLETAYALRSRFMGLQNQDTVKLVVTLEAVKSRLTELRDRFDAVSKQRKLVQRQLDDIQVYEGIKHTVLTIQSQHRTYLAELADKHEHDRLIFIKKAVEEVRAQSFLRVGEVETVLRTQGSLRERYHEEVVSEINRIEKEMRDREQIEKALLAIPRENTIAFVNGIFKQANILIESIWTVPFQIELLKPEDHLDYTFTVTGDNQSSREMSECSEGQTEILSHAINLALRMQLGILDYPLCLDEAGRTLDDKHKQNLVLLLKKLLDDRIISQLFYVSHHAAVHEAFSQSETLVIREDNILLPERYNEHAVIK